MTGCSKKGFVMAVSARHGRDQVTTNCTRHTGSGDYQKPDEAPAGQRGRLYRTGTSQRYSCIGSHAISDWNRTTVPPGDRASRAADGEGAEAIPWTKQH